MSVFLVKYFSLNLACYIYIICPNQKSYKVIYIIFVHETYLKQGVEKQYPKLYF